MVRFVNIEDFLNFIKNFLDKFFENYPDKEIIFYDGDYKDSL